MNDLGRLGALLKDGRILKVQFFKRDELTSDLVCCDIETEAGLFFCHEEAPEWSEVLALVATLEGFDPDWREKVIQRAFEENRTTAFER
ncbi:hypothetical protein VCJ71_05425 [Alteriqipengyuania sp. WL0013]|uniref:hypothetical protein n=1 Tax=Alteriqipengyuania sp. WL0013 TaxID=3110773 RepID=UPI002C5FFBD7|nr:hypothetical protein [Alteriqipengyuania sp. WL0013]MEB3415500.1 hypothetical protein [Alteriqipengyuania sp. WL0013]